MHDQLQSFCALSRQGERFVPHPPLRFWKPIVLRANLPLLLVWIQPLCMAKTLRCHSKASHCEPFVRSFPPSSMTESSGSTLGSTAKKAGIEWINTWDQLLSSTSILSSSAYTWIDYRLWAMTFIQQLATKQHWPDLLGNEYPAQLLLFFILISKYLGLLGVE